MDDLGGFPPIFGNTHIILYFQKTDSWLSDMAGKWGPRIEDVFPIENVDIPASYDSLPPEKNQVATLISINLKPLKPASSHRTA